MGFKMDESRQGRPDGWRRALTFIAVLKLEGTPEVGDGHLVIFQEHVGVASLGKKLVLVIHDCGAGDGEEVEWVRRGGVS
jgi:hypothetical protein